MRKLSRVICSLLIASLILSSLWIPTFADEIQYVEKELAEEITPNGRSVTKRAIIIIPGVGGSVLNNSSGQACWLWAGRLGQLACTTSGTSVNTITPESEGYGLFSIYETLWTSLYQSYSSIYDVLFFSYDWRMSCADAASRLASLAADYDEVILVAHSMGGLVASKYCAMSSANRSKVDKMITLGTPYTGAPHLLYVAETGDFNWFVSILGGGNSTIKSLMANFHCTYQLAPTLRYCTASTDPYRYYIVYGTNSLMTSSARSFYAQRPWAVLSNGSTKTMANAAVSFHNSLLVSGTHIANSSSLVDTYKIFGTGYDTITQIIYDEDGNYIDNEVANYGDDTVPAWSATNTLIESDALKTYSVESTHMDLPSNSTAITLIKSIIGATPTVSASLAETAETNTVGGDNFELPDGIIAGELEVNEKGWLTSTDNRRIKLIVDADAQVDITVNGYQLEQDGNSLFTTTGDYCGSVWVLGNGKVKYLLKFNNYDITVNENASPVEISYMDDGYVESVETYDCDDYATVFISLACADECLTTVTAANSATTSSFSTISPEKK